MTAMPAHPAEVLRQAIDAFTRGDFESMLALVDPEIEVYIPENPDQQIWHGREGMAAAIANWTGAFDDYSIELQSVEEAGDRALAVVLQRGRAQLTGGPLEGRMSYVIEVRDGLMTRWELYIDPAEARASFERPR